MVGRFKNNLIVTLLILCLALHLFAFGHCYGSVVYAASSMKAASEYEIKAVYLYNFLLFAKWPDDDKSDDSGTVGDVCIGIVGDDPFGDSFSEIEGEVIKSINKKLTIKRYDSYKGELDLSGCKVLFVCDSERGKHEAILKKLKGTRTLTIADSAGFLKHGGMINLVSSGKKIRWEINRTPLKKANIQLSSQLLRSAVKIVDIPKLTNKDKDSGLARRTKR
jgi:hypothetical protein